MVGVEHQTLEAMIIKVDERRPLRLSKIQTIEGFDGAGLISSGVIDEFGELRERKRILGRCGILLGDFTGRRSLDVGGAEDFTLGSSSGEHRDAAVSAVDFVEGVT